MWELQIYEDGEWFAVVLTVNIAEFPLHFDLREDAEKWLNKLLPDLSEEKKRVARV